MAVDLTKLSDKDIDALIAKDYASLSDSALDILSAPAQAQKTTGEKVAEGVKRGAGVAARAIAPAAAGAAIGSAAGPAGALVGGLVLPAADLTNQLINLIASPFTDKRLIPASQAVQNLMTYAGVPGAPETQTVPERVLSAGLNAMTDVGTQIPAAIKLGKAAVSPAIRQTAEQIAIAPKTQAVVAPVAGMVAQGTYEATKNPYAAVAAGVATGTAGGYKRPVKEQALSSEALDRIADAKYAQLDASGIELNSDNFVNSMSKVAKDLRAEGYTPKAYPKVSAVIDELTSTTQPKDLTEIKALRKMIQGAQKSIDPDERRLASLLKDEFDTYMLNVPKTDILKGDVAGAAKAWEDARQAYSKSSKADVFEKMIEDAMLDKSKFTQSGAENSMAQQLRQLAKNDKRMRLFTASEQDAIREAAKGDTAQNLFKFFGRFAPTGPVSGIFTGGMSVINPAVGIPLALTAAGSRALATNRREQSIRDLANLMRMGRAPEVVSGRLTDIPAMGVRGLLSVPELTDEERKQFGLQ